jgi:hypothetical protein
MVIHHVFFWLQEHNEANLQKLLTGLKMLESIKAVRKIHIGLPASTESRDVVDHSYSASELLFFDDLIGQLAYQNDPVHKKFIAECGHLWKKVIVYDSVEV